MKNILDKDYGVTELRASELVTINGGGVYDVFKDFGSFCRKAVDHVVDAFSSMESSDHTKYGGAYLESISGRSGIM